jgi:hypothetical protein
VPDKIFLDQTALQIKYSQTEIPARQVLLYQHNVESKMKIRFRDVSSGIVEARAIIEIGNGVFLNEVTILHRDNELEVELPQKGFKGKDMKMHYIDIITFENEDKKTLFELEVKEAFQNWRRENKKVLVYEA